MKINDISQYLQALTLNNSGSSTSTAAADTASGSDLDSYVSSIGSSSSSSMPSETYNNIMEIIKANKQAAGESASAPTDQEIEDALSALDTDSSSSDSDTAETVSASSASGSSSSDSSSSDSSSDTETETVTGPDGSIYLRTTTTDEDGNETVTVTKLSGPQMPPQDNRMSREMPPQMGQGVGMPPMTGDQNENENSSSTGAEETSVQSLW
jgi:hypothetical protein